MELPLHFLELLKVLKIEEQNKRKILAEFLGGSTLRNM